MKPKFEKLLAERLGLRLSDTDPVWCDARTVLITGGYRAGKSTRGAFKAFKESLNPAVRLIWLVGPDYSQATEEFRMIMEWCIQLDRLKPGTLKTPMDGSRSLETRSGCTIVTKSAAHPERLGSVAPDGIVLCEPSQMSSEAYHMALGRLAQKRGWLFMVGTMANDANKMQYVWYENLAIDWMGHKLGSRERSFTLPSWSNLTVYPEGINDPELQAIKNSGLSEFEWDRLYGGKPSGVPNPCFPGLWEVEQEDLFNPVEEGTVWVDGAIGVDFGTTDTHPSAVVAVQIDQYGRYWIREGWQSTRADVTEIQSQVERMKDSYGIWQGCTDPNQRALAEMLGFVWASSTGSSPTLTRISLTNGLVQGDNLLFDLNGAFTEDIWASMRMCYLTANRSGELRFARPLGDDLAQSVMYAIELLRSGGMHGELPPIDAGSVRFANQPVISPSGRV